MNRRGFLATIAAFFTPKPTTILVPAPTPDDTPFLFLTETISLDEFRSRYLSPACEAIARDVDRRILSGDWSMMDTDTDRLTEVERRFDPRRLPA